MCRSTVCIQPEGEKVGLHYIFFVKLSAYKKNLLLSAKMSRENPWSDIQCEVIKYLFVP
jgi:hypothetical protein